MKIIESYNDFDLTVESKKVIYKQMHKQEYLEAIKSHMPKGKSVWIDSNGDGRQENIIAFEHRKWQGIFDPRVPIKYYNEFKSKTMVQAINKYIKPTSVVIYESDEFRYITPETLCNNLKFLHKSFNIEILIYIDLIGVDYNKLKYTKENILDDIKINYGRKITVHRLDNFKYLLKINR
tara:strand:+ start:679 stop:1215 length:537 start_codon:yes stop_codon:yes gene_type:complete